jgi:hypothetical protein
MRYPIPTRAPAEIASIQSRTGMAQRMTKMKKMKKTRAKVPVYCMSSSMVCSVHR